MEEKKMPGTSVEIQRSKEELLSQKAKRENVFDQMDAVFDRITRRAFQLFEEDGHMVGRDLQHWFNAEQELLHPVCTELTEAENLLTLKAEVPGFSEKELEIKVEPRRVLISGERESTSKEERKAKTIRSEMSSDQILRVVELPVDIETDKVTATLKDGMLAIEMRKAAA
jgi:HSP20 family molecular chaperone IbpA